MRLLAGLVVLFTLLATGGAAAEPTIVTSCNEAIPLSDGVTLRGNLRHVEGARVPTILTMTGYGKDNTQHFAACNALNLGLLPNYAILIVDERGTGSSGGTWDWWGPRTQVDYQEVLDWIQAQPWSDGSVGVTGGSYMGITSLFVAEADAVRISQGKPRAVEAVWADVPMADLYRDIGFHGGNPVSFFNGFIGLESAQSVAPPGSAPPTDPAAAANRVDRIRNLAEFSAPLAAEANTGGDAAYDNEFYRVRSPITRAHTITAPVAWQGGWFDIFQRGEPLLWEQLTNAKDRLWFQGPQYHAPVPSGIMQKMGIRSLFDVRMAWWDRWLRDIPNGVDEMPEVNVYTMGAGRWLQGPSWPLPDVTWESFHLDAPASGSAASLNDGRLVGSQPGAAGNDLLPALPAGGVCNRSQAQWTVAGGTAGTSCDTDNRHAERSALTYTTEPLDSEVEITGPIVADLYAELTRPDASLHVTISDVAPDGTSTQITQGSLNAGHRAVDEDLSQRMPCRSKPSGEPCGPPKTRPIVRPWHPFTREAYEPATAGAVERLLVEVFPTSHAFAAGHRIRVAVTAADVPHMTPTAGTLADSAGGLIRLHRGPEHPSHVLLPLRPTG